MSPVCFNSKLTFRPKMEADCLITGVAAILSVTTDVFNDLISLKAK